MSLLTPLLQCAPLLRRFRRDHRGATAVELGLVGIPFVAMVFAILETGLALWAQSTLETSVERASRMIKTGQAQQQNFTAANYRDKICSFMSFIDCSALKVDVRTAATFNAVDLNRPLVAGKLETNNFTYTPGKGGDIVVVRVYYEWPSVFNLNSTWLNWSLANTASGKYLLGAADAFRNEPFPW